MKKFLALFLALVMCIPFAVFQSVLAEDAQITSLTTLPSKIYGIVEGNKVNLPTGYSNATSTDVDGITLTPTWTGLNFTFGDKAQTGELLRYTAAYTAPEGYVFASSLATATENTSLSADGKTLTYTFFTYVIPKNAVYIDDNGSDLVEDYAEGNYEKPYATINKALAALGDDGVIVVKDYVTVSGDIGKGFENANVVIMGWDADSTIEMEKSIRFHMNSTELRDMTLYQTAGSYPGIYAQGNKLTLGDPNYTDFVITKYTGTDVSGVVTQLMATGDGGTFDGGEVIINRGTYDNVYASGYGWTTVNGNVKWTINGGKINSFTAGTQAGKKDGYHAINGNIYTEINGGTITTFNVVGYGGSTTTDTDGNTLYYASVNGDVNTVINGGSVHYIYGVKNQAQYLSGNLSLEINGGTFTGSNGSTKILQNLATSDTSEISIDYVDYPGNKETLLKKINTTGLSYIYGNAYYVDSTNGNDTSHDGLTPATAFATVGTAFAKFDATNGGRVYICGDYSPKASKWVDNSGRAKVEIYGYNDGRVIFDASMEFKGDTVIDNIGIVVAEPYKSIRSIASHFVIGENVEVTYADGVSSSAHLQFSPSVYTGTNGTVTAELNGGILGLTYGGELGGAIYEGDLNWIIDGAQLIKASEFILGSYYSKAPTMRTNSALVDGDINLTVNSGTISASIVTTYAYGPITGDVNVIINGGTVSGNVTLGANKAATEAVTITENKVETTYTPGIDGNVYVEINGGSVTGKITTKNRIDGSRIAIANNGLTPAFTASSFDYVIYNQKNGTVKPVYNSDGTVSFSIVPSSSALPIVVDGIELAKNDSNIYTLSKGSHTISYENEQSLSAAFVITPPRYGMTPITKVVQTGGANTYNEIGNCTASDIIWSPAHTKFEYDTEYTATVTLSSGADGLTFNAGDLLDGINVNANNKHSTYKSLTAELNDKADTVTVKVSFDAIPTPTPENTTQTLTGIFTTMRAGSNLNPAVVTITGKDNPGIVFTPTVTENGVNGSYSVPNIPIGTYTVEIRKPGYIPYIYDNLEIYSGRNIEIDADLLYPGDIDSSGSVDIDDLVIYLRTFSSTVSDEVLEKADIFEDSSYNVSGIAQIKANLGMSETDIMRNEKSRTMSFANTYYKLTIEKKLNIGYIGGSITANSGNKYYGYDEQFYDWMCSAFPEAEINYVQAGIGNTGSNYGIFRLESQLMRKTENVPDLVFLEYAVNDFNTFGQAHIEMLMESLILNVYKINPNADICILLTALSGYTVPRAAHIKVAEYYGIPVIDVGSPSGALNTAVGDCKVTTNDNLHPNTAGYELYTRIMRDRFEPYLIGNKRPATASLETRALPAPLKTNLILNPAFIDPASSEVIKTGSWATTSYSATNTLSAKYLSSKIPGDTMTFKFKGSSFGFIFMKFTNMGIMEYSVDGGDYKMFNAGGSQRYNHAQTYYIEDDLNPGEHTVTVRVTGYDAASSNNVYLPTSTANLKQSENCDVGICALLYNKVD